MASPALPKNLDDAPPVSRLTPFQRSFTLPARSPSRPTSAPASTGSADGIETLFMSSSSRIVSFASSGPTGRQSPSRSARSEDDPAASFIAWKTPTERTLAVGALRIYRVTASNVSFLSSGSFLHTIFPKSQCWCVDGQSTFVLRARKDSYYRIELQFQTDEDKDKIQLFKSVLSQVLQYEKTQNPFTQKSGAPPPERPKTPPRRQLKRVPTQKAKKWLFDKTWVPENHNDLYSTSIPEGSDAGTFSSYEEDDRSSIHTDASELANDSPHTSFTSSPPKVGSGPTVAERASTFQKTRSATAPSMTTASEFMSIMTRIPEFLCDGEPHPSPAKPALDRQPSGISSADSFYSLDTATPSPQFVDAEAELLNPWDETSPEEDSVRGRSLHRRQISEVTVRAPSADDFDEVPPRTPKAAFHSRLTVSMDARSSSAPSTPPLVSDSDEDSLVLPTVDVVTPPNSIRMKRLTGASQRRAFSPMPHPQNLFRSPRHTPSRELTNALIRKTCELVLGPPAHLVSLMLRIAASITNGFSFSTYRVRQTEKIPCSWESDDERTWNEDDFGIPLNTVGDSALRKRNISGDVD